VLKKSAPSRIITVASKGLITYPFLDIEFDNLRGEKKFSMQHAYYHAKQAQVMYTFDLAERLKGTDVTVNCVRVGNVAIPDERIEKHITRRPGRSFGMQQVYWQRSIFNSIKSMQGN